MTFELRFGNRLATTIESVSGSAAAGAAVVAAGAAVVAAAGAAVVAAGAAVVAAGAASSSSSLPQAPATSAKAKVNATIPRQDRRIIFPSEFDQNEPGRPTRKRTRILVVGTGLPRTVFGPTSQEARSAGTLVVIWGSRNLMYGRPDDIASAAVGADAHRWVGCRAASWSAAEGGGRPDRWAGRLQALWTTSPPTTVAATPISAIPVGSTSNGSASKTTRSASLPTSRVPLRCSSMFRKAAVLV